MGPRCLYCGSGCPWWDCDCARACEVRAGKRPKPRVKVRDGKTLIILDAEAAAHNALGYAYWRPNGGSAVHEQPHEQEAACVNTDSVAHEQHERSFVHAPADVNTAVDRKAYRAAWMRRKRAEGRS